MPIETRQRGTQKGTPKVESCTKNNDIKQKQNSKIELQKSCQEKRKYQQHRKKDSGEPIRT